MMLPMQRSRFPFTIHVLLVLLTLTTSRPVTQAQSNEDRRGSANKLRFERLEREFEQLHVLLRIPGISAAIVKDQRLIWAKGFGFADRENKVAASAETPYPIASLTKTFAATLLMQLVEQGRVNLDDPIQQYLSDQEMKKYFGETSDTAITVRHVLTHTSEGSPGESYNYSGFRFGSLTTVIEKASGRSFRELIVDQILKRAEMSGSVPGHDVDRLRGVLKPEVSKRYLATLSRLAKPYKIYDDNVLLTDYPPKKLNSAAGLISNVVDLGRYDAALDRHLFIEEATQAAAWTAAVSKQGKTLPYGLGWFVQNYQGLKLVYHYGWWPNQFSSLLLKIPDQHLTLILLANSDGLSAPFAMGGVGEGDVSTSPFAAGFIRAFVLEDLYKQVLPSPRWTLDPKQFSADFSDSQSKGYKYEAELRAHARVLQWLEFKRQQARPAAKVDDKALDAIAGEYLLRPGLSLYIEKQGGKLMMLARGAGEFELVSKSATRFFNRTDEFQVTFVPNGKGQITHLILHRIGQDLQATKVH
jgi:CubicO group peptidase (beta-lactamase class C family)